MGYAPRRLLCARWPNTRLTVLLAMAISRTSALSQQYCASINTGSDSSAVSNNYQSNGACSTSCNGYAFAVVQGKSCWCSNYAPGDTTSKGDCSVACPGYPYESCGNQASGLYGYLALGPAPSGTQGTASGSPTKGPTSTQPSQPAAQSNFPPGPRPVTVQDTVTAEPSVQVSYVSITTSSTTSTSTTPKLIPASTTLDTPTTSTIPITTSTTSPPAPVTPTTPTTPIPTTPPPTPITTKITTSSTPTSTWTPTPFTSVMTVTGQVQTLTITPTAPPAATTTISVAKASSGGFFSNPGKVAGTFVAVAIILALLAAVGIWFCLRRKRQAEVAPVPSTAGDNTPQRRPSRLSQMGLIGGAGREKTVPSIQTSGWGPANSAEKSPADTLNTGNRRNSYPPIVDQRLEPTALWNPIHDNGSHVSVRSFRDDQDYSRRMLRIANPDDE